MASIPNPSYCTHCYEETLSLRRDINYSSSEIHSCLWTTGWTYQKPVKYVSKFPFPFFSKERESVSGAPPSSAQIHPVPIPEGEDVAPTLLYMEPRLDGGRRNANVYEGPVEKSIVCQFRNTICFGYSEIIFDWSL